MCNCENAENTEYISVLPFVITVLAALSFILGFIAGISAARKIYGKRRSKLKKTVTTDYGDFDADEYVRSLNFD